MKDTKKKRRWKEDWDAEFAEEYGTAPDTGSGAEGEDKEVKPLTMLLVFVVLVAVAALLSVVLWTVTHMKQDTVVLPSEKESAVVDYVNQESTASSDTGAESEPEEDPNIVVTSDGREVVFVDCDNMVTPKEYVNLRTEPSTAGAETTVYCKVHAGELLHRTGYSPDFGWSRLEYGDVVLYVVTSNVEPVEE